MATRLRIKVDGIGGGEIAVSNTGRVALDRGARDALRKLILATTISLDDLCDADVVPRGLANYFAKASLPKPVVRDDDVLAWRFDRGEIESWCRDRRVEWG